MAVLMARFNIYAMELCLNVVLCTSQSSTADIYVNYIKINQFQPPVAFHDVLLLDGWVW